MWSRSAVARTSQRRCRRRSCAGDCWCSRTLPPVPHTHSSGWTNFARVSVTVSAAAAAAVAVAVTEKAHCHMNMWSLELLSVLIVTRLSAAGRPSPRPPGPTARYRGNPSAVVSNGCACVLTCQSSFHNGIRADARQPANISYRRISVGREHHANPPREPHASAS